MLSTKQIKANTKQKKQEGKSLLFLLPYEEKTFSTIRQCQMVQQISETSRH